MMLNSSCRVLAMAALGCLLFPLMASLASGQTLAVGTTAYFWSMPNIDYSYNPPLSVLNPWTFAASLGGTAFYGSPFDPNPPSLPPTGDAYGFLQTSPNNALRDQTTNMNVTVTGMTIGSSYEVSFYWATRGGSYADTQDTVQLLLGGLSIWTSAVNLSDGSGWISVTANFSAVAASELLDFVVSSSSNSDHAVLITAVLVALPNYTMPTPLLPASTLCTWQYPILNTSLYDFDTYTDDYDSLPTYVYNPPVTSTQPWSWTPELGGVALSLNYYNEGPWNPPPGGPGPPPRPPSGSQFAFIQTSPNGALLEQSCNMSASLSLIPGLSYGLSFYWATRGFGYNVTQSQLTVIVDAQVVYTSAANLSDADGWHQAFSTSTWSSSAATVPIVFAVKSSSNNDHAILIADLLIAPPNSSTSSSTAAASSSSSVTNTAAAASSVTSSAPSSSPGVTAAATSSSSSATLLSTGRPTAASSSMSSSAPALTSSTSSAISPSSSSSTGAPPVATPSSTPATVVSTSTPVSPQASSSTSAPIVVFSSTAQQIQVSAASTRAPEQSFVTVMGTVMLAIIALMNL